MYEIIWKVPKKKKQVWNAVVQLCMNFEGILITEIRIIWFFFFFNVHYQNTRQKMADHSKICVRAIALKKQLSSQFAT